MRRELPEPTYTAAEVDAAIAALEEPERVRHAQEVVTHAAPALQRVLAQALQDGGWFGPAHDAEVGRAVAEPEREERMRAVATLVAEQTRLGMFVGAAVGFELAHELQRARAAQPDAQPGGGQEPDDAPGTSSASAAHPSGHGSPTT